MVMDSIKSASIPCPACGRLNRIRMDRAGDSPRCGKCAEPISLDRPVPITDQRFDRVIADAEVPVLVDFYADWCGPCKMMAPLLDDLARSREGQALVLKLDTEANPMTAGRFQIRGIPTLIRFERGQEVRRQVGAVGRERLENML